MTTYYEDPYGILKTVRYEVSEEDARAFERKYEDDRQALLDGHVARGAIERRSCPRWNDRLMEDWDTTADILDGLPDDSAQADRAYENDPRIRAVEDEYLAWLGVEKRPVEYEADGLSRSEREYREYAAAMGIKAVGR